MKCNIAVWDRVFRFVLGVLLLIYAIAGGPIWTWFGLYLLFTAGWGLCFIYAFLKIRTAREPQRTKALS